MTVGIKGYLFKSLVRVYWLFAQTSSGPKYLATASCRTTKDTEERKRGREEERKRGREEERKRGREEERKRGREEERKRGVKRGIMNH